MRLALTFPSSWKINEAPDGRIAAVLAADAGAPPAAIVTYGPLIVKPDEPRLWADQTARSDLPRGTRVKIGPNIDQTTQDGWPMRLVEAEVTTEAGELVELRVCVFYTFMEHGAAVIVRSGSRASLDTNGAAIRAILATGRPDWRAQPLCVADVWDLEPPRATNRAVTVARPAAPDFFAQELARLEAIAAPSAADHVQRGLTLLALQRPEEALEAARTAIALDDSAEPAHYLAGVVLGTLGRHADAIAAWTLALARKERVDTHYNLGQARYTLRDFANALQSFRAARALDPSDVMLQRKIVQCLYALDRFDEGAEARTDLTRAWAASRDPRVRMATEFVFDQFDGEGIRVHAVELLRQRDAAVQTVFAFRAVDRTDHALGATVLVETSEMAKRAGTPFVVGISVRGQFKVAATLTELPPYPELRKQALTLLVRALAPN